MVAPGLGEDFAVFYRREYVPVVRLAYTLTGRWEVAEEFARDCFLAAERQWEKVGGYDSPAGWVRRVATNQCISGFHKARHELEALVRLNRGRVGLVVDLRRGIVSCGRRCGRCLAVRPRCWRWCLWRTGARRRSRRCSVWARTRLYPFASRPAGASSAARPGVRRGVVAMMEDRIRQAADSLVG